MEKNIYRLGTGDPAGGDEILLVKSITGDWLCILPWGMDYGCGIQKVVLVSENDVKVLVEKYSGDNMFLDTNEAMSLIGKKGDKGIEL